MGKKAITPDGNAFGEVKDIAFNMDGTVGLVIAAKSGSEVIVPLRQAAAIGEYVLLASVAPVKPAQPSQPPPVPKPTACPSCGSPTKPGAKFCGRCGHSLQ